MALQATAAAAAYTPANKLTAAKTTVTRATAQKDLAHAISVKAQTIAKEAAHGRERAHVALAKARCARSTIIDPIEIAQADEQIKIAEVTLCKMDITATEKGHIAYGVNAFDDRACKEYKMVVKVLDKLCERMMGNSYGGSGNGTSTSSHGSVKTPCSTSTLPSISTNQGVITQTPGTIFPGNPYVRALS